MGIKLNLRGFFRAYLLLSVMSAITFADTIRFKDGTIVKGNIVSFRSGNFVVEVGEGSRKRQLTYAAAAVESITFNTAPVASEKLDSAPPMYSKHEPKIIQPPKTVTTDPTPRAAASPTKSKPTVSNAIQTPVEWSKKVSADNTNEGWTSAGWVAKKGQRIRITADGIVLLGKGQSTSPSGDPSINDEQKLMKSVPTGALIAVIGDDNNDFIYIGAEREFTALRDGPLFLGINEGILSDNSGTFDVKVQIISDGKR